MTDDLPKKRGRGRPKKSEIEAKKPGNRKKRGRPPGEAATIAEYKARMLASPQSAKVLETIFNAALDDEHKNQASAWKIITDRIVPASAFEEKGSLGARGGIHVTISNVPSVNVTESVVDGEFTEVNTDE